jgi:hypothetical protein
MNSSWGRHQWLRRDPEERPPFSGGYMMAGNDKRRATGDPSRARTKASAERPFDIWLQKQLHAMYDEIASEPLPNDLLGLIERCRQGRSKRAEAAKAPAGNSWATSPGAQLWLHPGWSLAMLAETKSADQSQRRVQRLTGHCLQDLSRTRRRRSSQWSSTPGLQVASGEGGAGRRQPVCRRKEGANSSTSRSSRRTEHRPRPGPRQ